MTTANISFDTVHVDELRLLEAEAVHIIREVVAELERPVLLFSAGKDSIVLLRLAEKAFRPSPLPFPVMHVDTGHNFPEVIEFRDRRVTGHGHKLTVASVQESIDSGRVPDPGPGASRNRQQTRTLLDALDAGGFDAAFGGARRDGDNIRHGLSDDLGFSAGDRAENIRRVGHLTRLFADAGVVALASLVSPLKSDREIARALNNAARLPFIEVYVATPRAECERRDPKGVYARARAGELKGLTGVDAPYEPPDSADLVLDTTSADIDQLVAQVIGLLNERRRLTTAAEPRQPTTAAEPRQPT